MESIQSLDISELKRSLVTLKEKYDEGSKNQAELQEKIENVNFIITNTSAEKELKETHKKELEEYKNMRKIDLTKSLNGKKYPMDLERLIRTKEIYNTIDGWIKTLHCSDANCTREANMIFLIENSDQIYCEYHAYSTDNVTDPINLKDELRKNNTIMNVLEKKLLIPQMQMALIRSYMESVDPDSQIGK